MKENTFTYTARSTQNPEKMAMFTLHNGSVSVQLGNALMEQAEEAYERFQEGEADDAKRMANFIKPMATGSLQRFLQPIPLKDFDAEIHEDAMQATAWIRAGGLRLAPVMMTWQDVDNPAGAKAFVSELHERKEAIAETTAGNLPDPFDYWASWIAVGLFAIVLPIVLIRQFKKRQENHS